MHKVAEDQSEIRRRPALDRNHTALTLCTPGADTLPGRATTNHTSVLCACIFMTIDFAIVFRHLAKGGRDYFGRMTMKTIRELTVVSAVVFSAFALVNIS